LIDNVQDKKICVLDKKEKMVISRQDKAARKLHDYPPSGSILPDPTWCCPCHLSPPFHASKIPSSDASLIVLASSLKVNLSLPAVSSKALYTLY
jgi:hypothetical protein